MSFFDSLLVLMLAAIALLQVSRRLALPYPAMLAAAGVVVALIPGTPTITIDADVALTLFIAPAIVDAAYDFPPGTARRFWLPLVAFAIVAVIVTTALVAWTATAFLGIPIAAAVVLGAIVSPPDAAAATAVLLNVSIPRNSDAVLKGESLFNDAMALLLFNFALTVQTSGGLTAGVVTRFAIAAPGGLLLGIGIGLFYKKINRFVGSTMGGNLLQFVNTFVIWVVAQRLGLSAVLCLVAFAMTIARQIEPEGSTRMRVHSFAVWRAVIFVLNVFAFLLMGMQARTIVEHMKPERLAPAFAFAAIVVAVVIATRLAVVIGFNRLAAWWARLHGREEAATFAQGVLVGWSGMRGLVTLATAFALPQDFPQRDAVVLAAFSVVIATLVIQGLTMTPLIRFLKLDRRDEFDREIARARADLAGSALEKIAHVAGAEADNLRYAYTIERAAATGTVKKSPFAKYRKLGLAAIGAERETLYKMRSEFRIGADGYLLLQEELDWRELTLLSDDDRQIEDS